MPENHNVIDTSSQRLDSSITVGTTVFRFCLRFRGQCMCKPLLNPADTEPGRHKLAYELNQRGLLVWNMTDGLNNPIPINHTVKGIVLGVIETKHDELTERKDDRTPKTKNFVYDARSEQLRRSK